MAIPTFPTVGDNYHRPWNTVLKIPKANYTAKVGDLVIVDTSLDNAVDILAADTNPYGIIESINSGNGLLSVTEFTSGCTIVLPYSGAVSRGDKVEGDGGAATHNTTLDRSPVRHDNVNGVGTVIAVDAGTPYGTGFCTVRFS